MAVPPRFSDNAPPMVHSTVMKVAADNAADTTPTAKSIGASVATRRSCAIRYSGLSWSPLTRLSWK